MKTKNYNEQQNKYWTVEDRGKVLFSGESNFLFQGSTADLSGSGRVSS